MDAAAFGPYFTVDEVRDGDDGWRRLDRLLVPGALQEQVEATRSSVDPDGVMGRSPADVRAVASTMVLGLFARLVSPVVGASLAGGRAPRPDAASLWLGDTPSGPPALATSRPLVEPDPRGTLDGVLVPVGEAVGEVLGVPRKVLLGNMAASVVGACQVVSLVRPDLEQQAERLRRDLLNTDLLAGSGTVEGPFVRASCCQIHRLPMGYVCPNCILVAAGTRLARERSGDVHVAPGGARRRPDLTRAPFR